jgi:hypothetical protein
MAMLRNARVWWAKVHQPDKEYHCWTVDAIVDKKTATEFKKAAEEFFAAQPNAAGKGRMPKITVDEERSGYVIKIRRNIKKVTGEDNAPPKVVDAGNAPLDKLIGNDSVANVQYKFYLWSNKFGKGVGVDLCGIQVMELVPYAGKSDFVEDGDEFAPVGEMKVKKAPEETASEDVDDLLD